MAIKHQNVVKKYSMLNGRNPPIPLEKPIFGPLGSLNIKQHNPLISEPRKQKPREVKCLV